MQGRPARVEPVFIWQTPPTWLRPFDQHDRITVRSSAQPARWGSQSETQSPPRPYCFHFRFEASNGEFDSPIGVITGLKLDGSRCPASSSSFGLGSNVSIWLGPPPMKRKITLLARALTRQVISSTPEGDPARARSPSSRPSNARAPKPPPPRRSHSRRLRGEFESWAGFQSLIGRAPRHDWRDRGNEQRARKDQSKSVGADQSTYKNSFAFSKAWQKSTQSEGSMAWPGSDSTGPPLPSPTRDDTCDASAGSVRRRKASDSASSDASGGRPKARR